MFTLSVSKRGEVLFKLIIPQIFLFASSQTSRATLADITFLITEAASPSLPREPESLQTHSQSSELRPPLQWGNMLQVFGENLDCQREETHFSWQEVICEISVGSMKVQLNHPGAGYDGDTCDTRPVLNQKYNFSVWLQIKDRYSWSLDLRLDCLNSFSYECKTWSFGPVSEYMTCFSTEFLLHVLTDLHWSCISFSWMKHLKSEKTYLLSVLPQEK